MDLRLTPTPLRGSVTVPASKSMSHRMVIAAALAHGGESMVDNLSLSEDITATLKAVKMLGASYEMSGGRAVIRGGRSSIDAPLLDCGESGSTLRFLIPIALALTGEVSFTGHGRLMERPLDTYFDLFDQKGISHTLENGILTVKGTLTGGEFPLSGAVSSQFITGLLFTLPLLKEDSRIVITDSLSSKAYVAMTLDALKAFGIQAEQEGWNSFAIPGGQKYQPRNVSVEGDYSQAAFFLEANFTGSKISLDGLNPDSLQGDRAAADILASYKNSGEIIVDADEIPDLIPALAAAAAFRTGEVTRFVNAGRLRVKESDRIASTVAMLRALGAKAESGEDSITVYGSKALPGNVSPVNCQNDHRIAMAAGAASCGCENQVTLLGAECVRKSYPRFWDDFRTLGGQTEQLPERTI